MDSNWFQQNWRLQDWEQQGWQQRSFGRHLPTDCSWFQQDWQSRDWEQHGSLQGGSGQSSTSLEERRGWSRPVSPATSPEHQTETHRKGSGQRPTTWRDKQRRYEDCELLRCPWPGGRETFGEPKEERWLEIQSEARDLGLVSLSVFFLIFF